jgi:DNA processing protein
MSERVEQTSQTSGEGEPGETGDRARGEANSRNAEGAAQDGHVPPCGPLATGVNSTAAGQPALPPSGAAPSFLQDRFTAPQRRMLAWAYLSRVIQGPSRTFQQLVAQFGPEQIAEVVWGQARLPEQLRKRTQARAHIDTAEQDLNTVHAMGGRLVTPDADEWPGWKLLPFNNIDGEETCAPLALWAVGSGRLAELAERGVAVVGTRAASGYGEHVTAEIAGDLALEGWTIVSGAAMGIDGAAHRAALGVKGNTVAALACGIDQVYPPGHGRLLQSIAQRGLVVSEYSPGTPPQRHRFLARNRLVAGLADSVVVVEAGARSGARNTAKWARLLGRPVLAVPGPVTSASSVGCHNMIQRGEALLAANAVQVAEMSGPMGVEEEDDSASARRTDALSGDARLVYEALPAQGASTVSEVSEESGVAVAAARGALAMLELEGLASSGELGWSRTLAKAA